MVQEDQNLIFINPEKGSNLVLTPRQITIGFDGDNFIFDFEWLGHEMSKVFDVLLLDKKGSPLVHLIGHYPSNGISSMEKSLEAFLPGQKETLKKAWPNLMGLGLRFLEKHGNDIWEFKLEPFIRDPRFYFLEGIFNHQEVPLDVIPQLAEKAYTYFKENLWGIARDYFIR